MFSTLLGGRPRRDVVRVGMPDWFAPGGELLLHGAGGRDLVAREFARHGWLSFERPLPDLFLACAARWPGLVLDVGANTGFYSLLALVASPQNRVLAFEPDPGVLPALRRNLRLNAVGRRVRVLAEAVSDRTGSARLHVPDPGHGLIETSSSLEAGFREAHHAVLPVRTTTLDKALADGSPPTLVKIDVEGHERAALAGGEGVLRRDPAILAVELLGGADYAWFNGFRDRLGYRSLRLRHYDVIVEAEVEWDPGAWVHVFVPPARWEAFLGMVEARGLAITR